jgi:hypothetical protein
MSDLYDIGCSVSVDVDGSSCFIYCYLSLYFTFLAVCNFFIVTERFTCRNPSDILSGQQFPTILE